MRAVQPDKAKQNQATINSLHVINEYKVNRQKNTRSNNAEKLLLSKNEPVFQSPSSQSSAPLIRRQNFFFDTLRTDGNGHKTNQQAKGSPRSSLKESDEIIKRARTYNRQSKMKKSTVGNGFDQRFNHLGKERST